MTFDEKFHWCCNGLALAYIIFLAGWVTGTVQAARDRDKSKRDDAATRH